MIRLTAKQVEYTERATHRWNIKTGAVRSGKSFVDTAAVIPRRIIERKGQSGLSVIIGVSKSTIERNVLQPMREIYGKQRIGNIVSSTNMASLFGEEVYCLGAEKVSQVSKIQGASFKYVYGDEVAKWNREVFEMLKSRMDKEYSCFDGACNPENPTHWLKEFIDSDDLDLYLQQYTIFDNPFLPEDFVRSLCKEYEGTVYYERLIDGKWKRAEGAIFRRFADNPAAYIRPADPAHLSKIVIGVDFGGNGSGHAFVATGFYPDGRIQALMSRKHMNRDFPQGIDANKLSELFLTFVQDVVMLYGMPDRVYWDNAETVLGTSIRNACRIRFPAIRVMPAAKKRIKDRIEFTVKLLGAGLFSMTPECRTLQDAMTDAVWNPKTAEDERLDDGSTDIDSLDAYEYTVEREIRDVVTVKTFDI